MDINLIGWFYTAPNGIQYTCSAHRRVLDGHEIAERITATNMKSGDVLKIAVQTLDVGEEVNADEKLQVRVNIEIDRKLRAQIS